MRQNVESVLRPGYSAKASNIHSICQHVPLESIPILKTDRSYGWSIRQFYKHCMKLPGWGTHQRNRKWVGLNTILFTHRNHKLNKQVQETQKQYAYLSVTYIKNDNHTDTYDSKMANYCQDVRGNKTNKRPK